jgi:transposase
MAKTRSKRPETVHRGPCLPINRKKYWVKRYLDGSHTTKHAETLARLARKQDPPEPFSPRTLWSWVRAYKQEPHIIPENRGRPPAVSEQRLEWVKNKVTQEQSSERGAPNKRRLNEIMNAAHRLSLKDRKRNPRGATVNKRAMKANIRRFLQLPGVSYKKRNVRCRGRFKSIR